MIATILNCEEWKTNLGHDCLRFTMKVDNDIAYGFCGHETFLTTLIPIAKFCHLPVIRDKTNTILKINPKRFVNKLIPVKRDSFRDKEFWFIDYFQIRKVNADE
jgi:hypothetical protein